MGELNLKELDAAYSVLNLVIEAKHRTKVYGKMMLKHFSDYKKWILEKKFCILENSLGLNQLYNKL